MAQYHKDVFKTYRVTVTDFYTIGGFLSFVTEIKINEHDETVACQIVELSARDEEILFRHLTTARSDGVEVMDWLRTQTWRLDYHQSNTIYDYARQFRIEALCIQTSGNVSVPKVTTPKQELVAAFRFAFQN